MKDIELWLFLTIILVWIVLVSTALASTGNALGGLVHLLPLAAVCILANRVRRSSAEQQLTCTEAHDRAILVPHGLAPQSHATPDEAIPPTRDQAAEAPVTAPLSGQTSQAANLEPVSLSSP
jgi:hypothetical protein